jgi:hypothetical protein
MPADDWLSAMLRNQYASPQGLAPGGGVMSYPAASGQGPNMGYPAQQGPPGAPAPVGNIPITPAIAAQLGGQPPQAQAPPFIQFGGFHPGNAVNPEFFHDLAATKAKLATLLGAASGGSTNSGDLIGAGPGAPGAPDPRLGSSVQMAQVDPTSAAALPSRPASAYGTGIFPGMAGMATPPEANFPEPTPTGQPSATPRPSGALAKSSPLPPTRPAAAAAPSVSPTGRRGSDGRFTTVQYQANPGRNQPIMTALNLADAFRRA